MFSTTAMKTAIGHMYDPTHIIAKLNVCTLSFLWYCVMHFFDKEKYWNRLIFVKISLPNVSTSWLYQCGTGHNSVNQYYIHQFNHMMISFVHHEHSNHMYDSIWLLCVLIILIIL